MNCPNCNIPVKPYFLYCPSCGMHLGVKRGRLWTVFFGFFAIVGICGGFLYLYHSDFHPLQISKQNLSDKQAKETGLSSKVLHSSSEPGVQPVRLQVGRVIIEDITGSQIASMPATVSASGWVAIPERLCLRGYNWYFQFPDGEQSEIVGGIIGDEDQAGLWQIENITAASGLRISPGNMGQPFDWFSILSDKSKKTVRLSNVSEQQNWYLVSFPATEKEPGVFIQNKAVVGWSFGDRMAGGLIWRGAGEANLVIELSVYDFYRTTFENSREEQFLLGYASKDSDPLKQLKHFAQGFRLEPKLAANLTPDNLKKETVVAEIRKTVSTLILSGKGYDVADIFDSALLSRIGDLGLLTDVVNTVIQIRGSENSVNIIEAVLRTPKNFSKNDLIQIRGFEKDLYKKWLNSLVDEGEYAKGLDIYYRAEDSIEDDPEIHILGIKLALSFDDWKTAQKILRSHQFPLDMADQIKTLEIQIAQLKSRDSEKYQEKDKIVIRFEPGSTPIPVGAVLNQIHAQNFIIDTGAARVTIPSKTARMLGIDIESAPIRQLITASQVISAPEVTIDSIQIGGWIEHDVKAFIVDLPEQHDLGLLGLNFLNRFRMEVNSKTGTLTLTPRQRSD